LCYNKTTAPPAGGGGRRKPSPPPPLSRHPHAPAEEQKSGVVGRGRRPGLTGDGDEPSPLDECRIFGWLYPVFEAVGYSEIQRDIARYS